MRNRIVSDSASNNRPLARLRVIDIATYIAAPYCATIMAEFGAEVIKVEQPKVGDPCRRLGTVDVDDEKAIAVIHVARDDGANGISIRAADRKEGDSDFVTQRIVGAADHHAAERRVLRAR
jgi:crotonobetainyl-CoA:carnitine CoA-transferase CaiB-like acyl-CoA transferase